MEIFISGSLAYDRIMDFPGKFADHILPDKIHILNVCFMVNGLTEKFGGTAGNIAYSLALLEEQPLILSTAGKDFSRYREWLERYNIPLHGIRMIPEEFTAGAYITTDQSDNQITGFNPGAMKYRSLFSFDDLEPEKTIAIVAPGNLEDMLIYCQTYKEKNIPYIFDPGQSIPMWSGERLLEMLTGASITISNDYELEMIMKKTGLSKSEIIDRSSVLITTLGENGSLIQNREEERQIKAVPTSRVADPTGAGDGYRAGLIKGLAMGKGLAEAAQIGSVCASFVVECYGTQEHFFTPEQFWAKYEENFPAD